MSKLIRRTVTWLVLPPVLLAAGLYLLALPTAKFVLSMAGGYASGVDLDINRIELQYRPWPLLASAPAVLHLTDVTLANPPGFEAAKFLTVRRIDVHFTPADLGRDPVTIADIVLHGVLLNLERRDLVSNAGLILTRLEAVEAGDSPLRLGRRFTVERLVLEDGMAQIAYARALGTRGQQAISLGDQLHSRIADADHGVGAAALLYEVIDRVVSDALVKVARDHEQREGLEARLSD